LWAGAQHGAGAGAQPQSDEDDFDFFEKRPLNRHGLECDTLPDPQPQSAAGAGAAVPQQPAVGADTTGAGAETTGAVAGATTGAAAGAAWVIVTTGDSAAAPSAEARMNEANVTVRLLHGIVGDRTSTT
jgi:hypothetical protein